MTVKSEQLKPSHEAVALHEEKFLFQNRKKTSGELKIFFQNSSFHVMSESRLLDLILNDKYQS